jgi:hypothetical protein
VREKTACNLLASNQKVTSRLVALNLFCTFVRNIFAMDKLPFIFGKSSDSVNFTNREGESARLEINFKSLINTTIISPKQY